MIETIYNFIQVHDKLATAGQPTPDELSAAAAAGFDTVINLATERSANALPEEGHLVRSLGMAYIHIPVEWDNPTPEDFTAFEQAMQRSGAGKVLLHCAANFRATAFYALYALKWLGWSEEQAEAFRARIWAGSDYPVWEQFIARMKAQIRDGSR
ncbi:MAG: protein tyrosine phosphatase family protein [Anaerolineae bacterium]|nr:protein tyrosine phosphatase family protein [Thermoflexales bacterium]MDW8406383.1 protein tyrosine phosphatase family protein [Anaerolineae bacterium]